MNAACTTAAASPAAVASSSVSTPPLGAPTTTAAAAAHFRFGQSSRRSSSSGSSSSSNGGNAVASTSGGNGGAVAVQQSKKRRRHSTLSSSGFGSGDSDNDAPPTFRLRLGSYVSDFRLGGRRRSHSPSPQLQPPSPSGLVRQRHQLRIQTSLSDREQVTSSVSPTTTNRGSEPGNADVDMDLDVQNTFQAMQVDSPTASPSTAPAAPFFSANPPAIPRRAPSVLGSDRRPSPIPSTLLQPLQTDSRYPTRSPSPLSTPASASLPSICMVANASPVTPGVFPTQSTILAARRTSRQGTSGSFSKPQNAPVSPSPLAHSTSYTQHSASFLHQQAFSSGLQHSSSFRGRRSRSTSTPPDPILASYGIDEGAEGQSAAMIAVGEGQVPPSPVRRHSDGKAVPSPLRYQAPQF